MIRLILFFSLFIIAPHYGQTGFAKGSYTTLDGITTDAYIETTGNWNAPFVSIRVKQHLNDNPRVIATESLKKLFISPQYEFVRQFVWKAPVWEADQQHINYTLKEAEFLQVVGYGKVSLFTYFEGTSQRIVYQTKSNRFMELVPPAASSQTGKPLDYKAQLKADCNSSFYAERDLKQLPYSLVAITEFIRNYNSSLPGDSPIVAHSEVMTVVAVPHEEENENMEIPFVVVEKSPVLSGCEKLATEEGIRTCLSNQLTALFDKHFQYPKEAAPEDQSKKMFVQFLFEKDGSVQLKTMRVAHPSIDKELRRVFGKIPKATPGRMRGKPVRVMYMQAFKMKE